MARRLSAMILLTVSGPLVSTGVMAQDVPAKADRLKASSHTAARPKHAPHVAPLSAAANDEAERAARLAENRRRFFEDQQAQDVKPEPVPEFGGYDAKTMSGTLSPGFKF